MDHNNLGECPLILVHIVVDYRTVSVKPKLMEFFKTGGLFCFYTVSVGVSLNQLIMISEL